MHAIILACDRKDIEEHGTVVGDNKTLGDLVLFYVAGIAFLTLMINATTTGWVLKKLGFTSVTEQVNTGNLSVTEQVNTGKTLGLV